MTNCLASSAETSDFSREEFLANRKAAGRLIDVETCDIGQWYVDLTDPYAYHLPPVQCSGRLTFVKSPESYGWVEERDLPEDKYRALYNRLDRAKDATTAEGIRNVVLEEYAREVMDLDKVIEHLVEGRCRSVPADIVLCGVRFAIAKLGRQGSPRHLRLERKFRDETVAVDLSSIYD